MICWLGKFGGRSSLLLASLAACLIGAAADLRAQDLEPRAYSNAPVGMNFVLAGYQYSEGALLFDPSLPITDADARVDTGIFGYVRTIDVGGKSAKMGVLIPYAALDAEGNVAGTLRTRNTSGIADPSLYYSVNLSGAPAMTAAEFRNYRQDSIVGMTFKLTPPLGDYDSDKLINLGTNRWTFEPEIGVSRAFGRWTLEGAASVYLFSDNTDFDAGKTRRQDPIYSVQAHAIYSFKNGVWASIGSTYYSGGQTEIDGVARDDSLDNVRTGFTVAVPVNRNHSVKFFGSTGISTRTGTDYDSTGVAWQYRWGGGL